MAAYYKKVDAIASEEGSYQPALDTLRILEDAFPEASTGSSIRKHKVTTMHHIRYDLVETLPDNFAAHGDALINLNPVFGQGCTKAAMDATTLDAFLRASPTSREIVPSGFSKKMIVLQTRRNRFMFDSTRWLGWLVLPRLDIQSADQYADYAHETTVPMEGETLLTGTFFRGYFEAILRLTHKVRVCPYFNA
jgi:hypothetical protein